MIFAKPEVKELYEGIQRIVAKTRGPQALKPPVSELVINVAESCNLACPYCFAAQGTYGGGAQSLMDSATARHVVTTALSQLPELRHIKLFGGEPFMNVPAMVSAMNSAREYCSQQERPSLQFGAVTNMTLFRKELVDYIADGTLMVTASVDGPAEIHDANRRFLNGRGSHEQIRRTISKYREKQADIYAIEAVYTTAHYKAAISPLDLDQYLRNEFGVANIIINAYHDNSEAADESTFNAYVRSSFAELSAWLYRTAPQACLGTQMVFNPRRTQGWCGMGRGTLTVSTDGKLYPCYTVLQDREHWSMDWIFSESGEIENSRKNLPLLTTIDNTNPTTTPLCADCDISEVCNACPGSAISFDKAFGTINTTLCSQQIGMIEGVLEARIEQFKAHREMQLTTA